MPIWSAGKLLLLVTSIWQSPALADCDIQAVVLTFGARNEQNEDVAFRFKMSAGSRWGSFSSHNAPRPVMIVTSPHVLANINLHLSTNMIRLSDSSLNFLFSKIPSLKTRHFFPEITCVLQDLCMSVTVQRKSSIAARSRHRKFTGFFWINGSQLLKHEDSGSAEWIASLGVAQTLNNCIAQTFSLSHVA